MTQVLETNYETGVAQFIGPDGDVVWRRFHVVIANDMLEYRHPTQMRRIEPETRDGEDLIWFIAENRPRIIRVRAA